MSISPLVINDDTANADRSLTTAMPNGHDHCEGVTDATLYVAVTTDVSLDI
jgi:hypothetical protein